jgi:hypothetical protein
MANCALALQPWESPKHLTEAGSQPPVSKLLVNSFPAQQEKGTCTAGRCSLRGMASAAFAAVCETYK